MNDDRRGFLRTMLAAGSALILPNQEPKKITAADIIRPMDQESPQQTIDMGDYYLIPKSSVRSWTININRDVIPCGYDHRGWERTVMGVMRADYTIDGVLPPGVKFNVDRDNKQSLIAADGTVLFPIDLPKAIES